MPQTLPTAIRNYQVDGQLEIDWSDGHQSRYSHEHLRVQCPCADCRGHTPEQAKIISGKENVRISSIDPVGNYALRISFDDGHDTGLYEFSELRHNTCQCDEHGASRAAPEEK
ncbi:MAG: gamma-butyrobetaine hydroxylase-like domain-containing protein [Mariprofundaceae bacterium]|nr:gamma-butyrobetaine hydroxylase-like domain-containing protein [Mariprofundaceae bacterium]